MRITCERGCRTELRASRVHWSRLLAVADNMPVPREEQVGEIIRDVFR